MNYKLALSGSGVNYFNHVGAYKAIHENFGPPSTVAGTSGGALIASLIAGGYSDPEELIELALEFTPQAMDYFRFTNLVKAPWMLYRKFGMVSSTQNEKALAGLIPKTMAQAYQKTGIKCHIVTADVERQKIKVFSSDSFLSERISFPKIASASMAFPFIFTCPEIEYGMKKFKLTDGGIVNGFAIDLLGKPEGEDFSIGLHIGPLEPVQNEVESFKELPVAIVETMMNTINTLNRKSIVKEPATEEKALEALQKEKLFIYELSPSFKLMDLSVGREQAKQAIQKSYDQITKRIQITRMLTDGNH